MGYLYIHICSCAVRESVCLRRQGGKETELASNAEYIERKKSALGQHVLKALSNKEKHESLLEMRFRPDGSA